MTNMPRHNEIECQINQDSNKAHGKEVVGGVGEAKSQCRMREQREELRYYGIYFILVVEGDEEEASKNNNGTQPSPWKQPSRDELSAIALSVNGATEEYLCMSKEVKSKQESREGTAGSQV